MTAPLPPPTYYVDAAGGDDGEDGLTVATAWQTASRLATARLPPGSRVYFLPGDYREELLAPASGTAKKPILFAAHRPDEPPVFWGSDILTGWAPSGIGADCYELLTAAVNWVLADHLFLLSVASTALVASTPGSWTYSGGSVYVHMATDPGDSVMTGCRRENLLDSNGHDHLIFRGFRVRESAKADAGYGVLVEGSTGVLVEGVEATEAGKHAIGVISASATLRRCRGGYMAPEQGFGGATTFVHYASGPALYSTVWEDCESDTGNDSYYPAFTTHGTGVLSILIDRMTANGYGLAIISEDEGRVVVRDSEFSNGTQNINGTRTIIERCSFSGANTIVAVYGTDCWLKDCNWAPDVVPNWQAGRTGAIIDEGIRTRVTGCDIQIVAPQGGCIGARNTCDSPTWTGNTFRNTGGHIVRCTLDEIPGLTSDNNVFVDAEPTFKFAADQQTDYTRAQWQALGYDLNSTFGGA